MPFPRSRFPKLPKLPNECPANPGGHEPAYPLVTQINGQQTPALFLAIVNPTDMQAQVGQFREIPMGEGYFVMPCIHCGMLYATHSDDLKSDVREAMRHSER